MSISSTLQAVPPQEAQLSHAKEPRVVVIREEFIALTGNPLIAAVLNQLVYWSGRVANFELFLQEEKGSPPNCRSDRRHGWFYKSSQELIEETMLCVTPATLRKYLNILEERGWIETRTNPQNKWDKTTQYRVNLRKLSHDLQMHGYFLPRFLKQAFLPNPQKDDFEEENKNKDVKSVTFYREENNESSNSNDAIFEDQEKANSNGKKQKIEAEKNDPSNAEKIAARMEKNYSCNTEITTKNTNKEHTPDARAREESKFSDFTENCSNETIPQAMVKAWQRQINNEELYLTKKRKCLLKAVLELYFDNYLPKWEDFCLRIKASSFLMGGGPRKWKATLDWTLDEVNLIKVLEGNFDDPEMAGVFSEKSVFQAERTEKTQALLSSIKDPVWKGWCSQLAKGIPFSEGHMFHEPLSLFELTQIADAHFIECEDERLIWIGSSNSEVLKAIETLRLKIGWVYEKEYPKARTIRTRLETVSPSDHTDIVDASASQYAPLITTGELYA